MLLLDDPFASVDVGTEARIIRALSDAFGSSVPSDKQSTIVLCSHRLTAFEHADVVLVLDKGRIVAQGSHEELLAAGGLYARICVAQHRAERAMRAETMR